MKFKKIIGLLLILTIVITVLPMQVFAEREIKVLLDGKQLTFDVPPQIINNRTMVPMRAIFEALGATVSWNGETKTATGTKMGIVVEITIDKEVMIKNYCEVILDTPAQLVNGRTMVPVRAVSESFAVDVQWDGATNTVILTDKNILQSIKGDNYVYEGEVANGTPCGYGMLREVTDDGERLKTGLFDGFFQKAGTMSKTKSNGDKYSVFIVDDSPNGYGEYTWVNGDCYKGNFENGVRNGYGELTLANGNCYKGNFKNDVINGLGEYTWVNGDCYKGNFENGVKNGYGEYTWVDGNCYKGNFENGVRNGYGELTLANGDCYKGNFKNDVINGLGEYTWSNGSCYKGNHENGLRNGYGEFYDADGDCYKGNYVNDEIHGYGKFYYANGDYYIGNFENGQKNGYGEYTWSDGSYYKGDFLNGMRHGHGIQYDSIYHVTNEGEFVNDKFVQTNSTPQGIGGIGSGGSTVPENFIVAKFPLYLYSNDGKTFLGKLTTNKYDAESIFNEYGTYGSKYSSKSIFNEYGTYGSEYNTQSAFNPYTTTPPIIVDSNFKRIGYLTANKYMADGVTILELAQILTTLNQ